MLKKRNRKERILKWWREKASMKCVHLGKGQVEKEMKWQKEREKIEGGEK